MDGKALWEVGTLFRCEVFYYVATCGSWGEDSDLACVSGSLPCGYPSSLNSYLPLAPHPYPLQSHRGKLSLVASCVSSFVPA